MNFKQFWKHHVTWYMENKAFVSDEQMVYFSINVFNCHISQMGQNASAFCNGLNSKKMRLNGQWSQIDALAEMVLENVLLLFLLLSQRSWIISYLNPLKICCCGQVLLTDIYVQKTEMLYISKYIHTYIFSTVLNLRSNFLTFYSRPDASWVI